MSGPYTYVDRFNSGLGITELDKDALLLTIYGTRAEDWLGVEVPAEERRKLADAVTDFYAKKIDRVLTVLREQRSGTGPGATVPVGAVLAAIYISDRKPSADDVKRAHEIQALIDAEAAS